MTVASLCLLLVLVPLCVKVGQLPTVNVKMNEVDHVKLRLVRGTQDALGKHVPPPSAGQHCWETPISRPRLTFYSFCFG